MLSTPQVINVLEKSVPKSPFEIHPVYLDPGMAGAHAGVGYLKNRNKKSPSILKLRNPPPLLS